MCRRFFRYRLWYFCKSPILPCSACILAPPPRSAALSCDSSDSDTAAHVPPSPHSGDTPACDAAAAPTGTGALAARKPPTDGGCGGCDLCDWLFGQLPDSGCCCCCSAAVSADDELDADVAGVEAVDERLSNDAMDRRRGAPARFGLFFGCFSDTECFGLPARDGDGLGSAVR